MLNREFSGENFEVLLPNLIDELYLLYRSSWKPIFSTNNVVALHLFQ